MDQSSDESRCRHTHCFLTRHRIEPIDFPSQESSLAVLESIVRVPDDVDASSVPSHPGAFSTQHWIVPIHVDTERSPWKTERVSL